MLFDAPWVVYPNKNNFDKMNVITIIITNNFQLITTYFTGRLKPAKFTGFHKKIDGLS